MTTNRTYGRVSSACLAVVVTASLTVEMLHSGGEPHTHPHMHAGPPQGGLVSTVAYATAAAPIGSTTSWL